MYIYDIICYSVATKTEGERDTNLNNLKTGEKTEQNRTEKYVKNRLKMFKKLIFD